jgi:hypothetical protein
MEAMSLIEGLTPEIVRQNFLPRAFLARSLTTRMALRFRRVEQLVARAHANEGDERIFAWMAALAATWTLVENTLKLYETIAEQIDIRYLRKRRGLDARFLRERSGDERVEFHNRVWMFSMFQHAPDSAFTAIGADPAAARILLSGMIERSIKQLSASEETMRQFYRKYKDVMNAHKHGRALFAFVPVIESVRDGEEEGSFVASSDAVTALVSEKGSARVPTRLITVKADAELISDVEQVLRILAIQVPKFQALLAAFANAAQQCLAFLEKSPDARRPTIPFWLFAEPYSDEEHALLTAIQTNSLRFWPATDSASLR